MSEFLEEMDELLHPDLRIDVPTCVDRTIVAILRGLSPSELKELIQKSSDIFFTEGDTSELLTVSAFLRSFALRSYPVSTAEKEAPISKEDEDSDEESAVIVCPSRRKIKTSSYMGRIYLFLKWYYETVSEEPLSPSAIRDGVNATRPLHVEIGLLVDEGLVTCHLSERNRKLYSLKV